MAGRLHRLSPVSPLPAAERLVEQLVAAAIDLALAGERMALAVRKHPADARRPCMRFLYTIFLGIRDR